MRRLVLASASPRRRELLAQAGFSFEVHPAHIPEDPLPAEDPIAYVVRLAREKADAVFAQLSGTQLSSDGAAALQVLGADTADLISTLDYNIYVKPTKPRFQRKVMYDNVPREAAKEFRTVVAAEGQEFLEKLDRWLAHHDRDVNPASKGTGRVRVGLGVFQFEEQEPPGDSHREDPSS